MKIFSSEKIRNVVIAGHGSVGKTTFTEAALFVTGATTRMGNVEEGNTVSDYDEDEHQRKFSVNLSILPVEWNNHKINLIDTPGYADFVAEVSSGMAAADVALIAVDAIAGLEVGTDRAWDLAEQNELPRMILLNRMDRENANFETVVSQLQEKWGAAVTPIQIPIGLESNFTGVVNLLSKTAFTGNDNTTGNIPSELQEKVDELSNELIEKIVENDEVLMEKYFDDAVLSEEELIKALKQGFCEGTIIPLVCAASSPQLGIHQVLETLINIAPSPLEREFVDANGDELEIDGSKTPIILTFKTATDPYVGRINYFRMLSGKLTSDSHLWNVNREKQERIGTIYIPKGKEQEEISDLSLGDIGVVAKLSETETGDTLTAKETPIKLKSIDFPSPVYSMAVTPVGKTGIDKLGPSLQRLITEDRGLSLDRDSNTGETILSGLGDTHLAVATGKLLRKFNLEVALELPRVPYRETIAQLSQSDYTHKKQSGGHGQYARVAIEISPLPRGSGLKFGNRVVGGSVQKEFIPAVEKGVTEAANDGVLAGYELTDCEIILYDGKHHPVDSSEMAFKLAGGQALKNAVQKGTGLLLEPVMSIRVQAPESFAGDIVGDLNTKRARIHGISPNGNISVVDAEVPLAEVQRYASDLRSLTQGRGAFELTFDHYGEVPANIAQRVIGDTDEEGK